MIIVENILKSAVETFLSLQGYGLDASKSSTNPKEVKPVDGVYIHKVACGHGHTLLIAKCDTDEEKERIDKLPVFEP